MAEAIVPTILEVLGEEWLRQQIARPRPLLAQSVEVHPIAAAFGTGDRNAVELLAELALYLRHLASASGFGEVVHALRDKFGSTMFQLAMAYRIGAHGPRVTLEPDAAQGRRGDIRFRWNGANYQAECYQRQPRRDPLHDVLEYTVRRCLEAADCGSVFVRVLIRLEHTPSTEERLELERRAIALIEGAETAEAQEVVLPCGRVVVQRVGESDPADFDDERGPCGPFSDAHVSVMTARVRESEAAAARLGPIGGVPRNRLMLWRPSHQPARSTERLRVLVDRIEEKLGQTRSADGMAKRIVFVDVGGLGERMARSRAVGRALTERILDRHSNVAMILVCARARVASGRWGYAGSVVGGRARDAICDAWMRWAAHTDYRRDLFSGWPLH